jgi:prepilin-type N-terminal cleavage/methylation domain-containing protein
MIDKKKKGFTLIELLIVIGIIAILAAAIIIAINPGQQFKQARNATRWSHMNSLANAVYSYVISSGGTYPTGCPLPYNVSSATTTIYQGGSVTSCDVLAPDHITALPTPPLGGEQYWIEFDNVGESRIKIRSSHAEAAGIQVVQ